MAKNYLNAFLLQNHFVYLKKSLLLHRFGDGTKIIRSHKRESGQNPEQYPLLYSSKKLRNSMPLFIQNGKAFQSELSQKTCQNLGFYCFRDVRQK